MKKVMHALLPLALLAGCTISQSAPAPAPARSLGAEEADRLRRASVEVLFWSQEQRDANFRRMHELFPARVVPARGNARPLPMGESLDAALGEQAIDRFVADQNIAGLIVLQDGRIRLERYARGFDAEQRWTSFSVAKSLTSTLVGAALREGHIGSLDDQVTAYVPELAGSGYDGVTVRQVLTMTSGVRWNEDYSDPASDLARFFSERPAEGEDVTVSYLRHLPRAAQPGTRWNYNTAETNLIGVIVARAVGRPLPDYLSDRIWGPYGMEADAYWQVNERGTEVAGCCISARLRDYARIGQFMLDGGRAAGRQVLSEGWVAEATGPQDEIGGGRSYGYQWWIMPRGYSAIGIFGQSIFVDPSRRIVMVALGAWPRASDRELSAGRAAFFQRVLEASQR